METAVMDHSIKRAVVGKRIELGGEQALQPAPRGLPWKKLLLWGVLLLGVGVLAFMARSLVQEMKVSKGDNESSQG
jgi:hypothetical protein